MPTATVPELERTREFFAALADATRLRIVLLLAQGEQCVCTIQESLGLPQPKVSRHLAVLRAAGLVAARRDGKWIHYRLAAQEAPVRQRVLRGLKDSGSPVARRRGRCAP